MSVGRICVRQVDVAKPEEAVQAGAQRMLARKVGTLVVVNKSYEPVGIVTDRDLTVRVLGEGRDPSQTMLFDVMTRDPVTITSETAVEDALRLMRNGSFRRLPVVDRAGKLSGVVSLDDILDLLSHEFGEIGRLLVAENPESVAHGRLPSTQKTTGCV
jgi:CBS domain-containing protein